MGLFFVIYVILSATLAGSFMVAALVAGYTTAAPVLWSSLAGFAVAVPATWIVAGKIRQIAGPRQTG